MDTDIIPEDRLHDLPPELWNMIFGHSEATALAKNRTVCAYWRNIIESMYPTRMEINNDNWEAFVKKSTASKIHLTLNTLQYPIYIAPEFSNFMSRVNILEVTGYITKYNLVNILNGCPKLLSLTVHPVKVDGRVQFEFKDETTELALDVSQLNIGNLGQSYFHSDYLGLLYVINHVGAVLKVNCLKKLNLSSVFHVERVLKLIFARILEYTPRLEELEDSVIKRILNKQRQSLQLITFEYKHGEVPPEFFIRFHRCADAPESPANTNSTNQNLQIFESHLFRLENYYVWFGFTLLLLRIFETQFRMRNLEISYNHHSDLTRIPNIIKNNSETLEEITIVSMEHIAGTYRPLSCAIFATCLTLKKLTLCSSYDHRKVKLLDLLSLPTSLEKLSLSGFVLTGSSELFGVPGTSHFPNFTEIELGMLPWFIQDESPVTVFENTHLAWLMNLFSRIGKITLTSIRLDRFATARDANTIGLENIPDSVSPEFIAWCLQGGTDNVKIDSIQISRGNTTYELLNDVEHTTETVYQILIGSNQH